MILEMASPAADNATIYAPEFTPPSDPRWWAFWHLRRLLDSWRATEPTPKPEQEYALQAGEWSGRALVRSTSGALTGNEISAAMRLRGLDVIAQPEESRNVDPASLAAILRAGVGTIRR